MTKDRGTLHRGKNGYAKHNEHLFKGKDKNIHGMDCTGCDNDRLELNEISFYEEHYAEMLEKQNEKYIERRQYARTKSITDLYNSTRYKPTEEILQVGSINSKRLPSQDEYDDMTADYYDWLRKWSEATGGHFHVLDYVNHYDEVTPHTHGRYIIDYVDADGVVKIGQEKGLEQMGVELPDESKPVGKYNNRLMMFTAMCRNKWLDICDDYGFEVEREPLPARNHMAVKQYIATTLTSRIDELDNREQALDNLEDGLDAREQCILDREHEQDEYESRYQNTLNALNKQAKVLSDKIANYTPDFLSAEMRNALASKTIKASDGTRMTYLQKIEGIVNDYKAQEKQKAYDTARNVPECPCKPVRGSKQRGKISPQPKLPETPKMSFTDTLKRKQAEMQFREQERQQERLSQAESLVNDGDEQTKSDKTI